MLYPTPYFGQRSAAMQLRLGSYGIQVVLKLNQNGQVQIEHAKVVDETGEISLKGKTFLQHLCSA